jgi:hypothetical protein
MQQTAIAASPLDIPVSRQLVTLTVVSYGGGTNSTAMLIGMHERGERPDYVTFADTGSEQEYTYKHMAAVNYWLASVGFPTITVVKPTQPQMVKDGSLFNECVRLGRLPSKAYGNGSCSLKWKVEPQNKYNRKLAETLGLELSQIVRLIGYDADEPQRYERAKALAHKQPTGLRFPLIEWDWGRDECVEAIERAGLPQPGKSSCVMCPSMKKHEILTLRKDYPKTLVAVLEMERRAMAGEGQAEASRSGLGRSFVWSEFISNQNSQACLFSEAGVQEIDCGCYDG